MQERTYKGLIDMLVGIISNGLVPLILGLAFVAFLWGVAGYMLKGSDPKEREKGRKFMGYGLIGLFVGLSVWSIVALFLDVIGVPAIVPQIK